MSDSPSETSHLSPLQRALLGIRELRTQLADAERAKTEPIAITGIGCRFPGGANDPQSFWRLLRDGTDTIEEMPSDRWDIDSYFDPDPEQPGKISTRWGGFLRDIDQFDPAFFGISPWEASNMDPQQRLMLEVAQEAFDDAGQVASQLRGSRTAVFIGLAHSEYGWLNLNQPELANVYTATGSFGSIVANRLSYVYDLRGPSYTMDAVCSSSLLAVHQACDALRRGDATMALAGGAGLFLKPEGFVWFTKLGVMSPQGRCRAFDASGNGIVLGEGVAAVVLKTLSRAIADGDPIYAVLRGSAVVQDGRSNGLTAPSRLSQEAMLQEAYQRSGVNPNAVQYVEAHGTGTVLGDPIEAQALGTILGAGRAPDRPLRIGSVKTNIGHLQMVGGLAGLIKVVLAMQHRQLPASLHYEQPNPHIPFEDYQLRVQDQLGAWPSDASLLAGVTSLSFGGTNVHVVVEEPPPAQAAEPAAPVPPARDEGRARLLPISAQDQSALDQQVTEYQRYLIESPDVDLDDLCYTASLRRNQYPERATVVFGSSTELLDQLTALQDDEARPGISRSDESSRQTGRMVFVFPGQGGQWVGMGQRLLEQEPVFREAMEACAEAVRPHVSWALLDELAAPPERSQLDRVDVVQPMTWAVQVALARLWRSWGVVPDAVVGHSMGEVAAACVAGALSLADGARVICRRSQLVRQVGGQGAMAVVELPLSQAQTAIEQHPEQLSIAASNSPTSTVLSGDPDAIDIVLQELEQRDVFCRRVNVDFASHSPQMDALRAELLEVLQEVYPQPGNVPIFSTVTGSATNGADLTADYWARNLREPVLFSTTVQQLAQTGYTLFVELSPHPIMQQAVTQSAQDTPVAALASLRRDEDERAALLGTLGHLYTLGRTVDWSQQYPHPRTVLHLPCYPWQRKRYWLDFTTGTAAPATSPPPAPGGRYFHAAVPGGEHFWEFPVDRAAWPELEDHLCPQGRQLPAAALLDLALVAGTSMDQGPHQVLSNVTFDDPVAVTTDGRTAQTALSRYDGGGAEWRILSRSTAASSMTHWQAHARGTLQAAAHTNRPYVLPQDLPDQVRQRCATELPGVAYHDSRATVGLVDGTALRAVQQLWRRDGELLALLQPQRSDSPRRTLLDWTLLEAAFGLLSVVAPAAGEAVAAYRPVGIERLWVSGAATGQLWAHVRLRETDSGRIAGDIRLLDHDQQVVVDVTGLRLHRVVGNASVPESERVAPAAEVEAYQGEAPRNRQLLQAVPAGQRQVLLTDYLQGEIAAVLGIPAHQLSPDQPLLGLGLNSLMIFELRNRIRVMYGTSISAEEFVAGISVTAIVGHVLDQLGSCQGAVASPASDQPASISQPASVPRKVPSPRAARAHPGIAVSTEPTDWLVRGAPSDRARMRLFCFPYAGGGPSIFRGWADSLPPEIEVCPVHLPGRGHRHQEPPFTQMSALVKTLGQVLGPYLDRPFALFGHSLGGLVGFELARHLRREGLTMPLHLYVSAARAPQLPDPEPPLHRLPDARLVEKLQAANGTPAEVLNDPETMALYLPAIRADFALIETYIHQTEAPLDCPITAFSGTRDERVPEFAMTDWSSQTRGAFTLESLPGDHFFIRRTPSELLPSLVRHLATNIAQVDSAKSV